ncbi:MAG: NAD(P)-dependent glycerol-3-phosphate dehydrogenase [Chlamydiae bacterium]|nr:NAD(P)-dependent glycerol-3-phosphate dehydrogenase [Chlamydiota bacterium]MBI3277081.1 NAD(P)-dependent glycerol-3-phosphate dehydrogenase [Chlamydiota bacterium]
MVKDKVAVIGNGGWGTTLAILLVKKGYSVSLWGAFSDYVQFLKEKNENVKFLPGVPLPSSLKHTAHLDEALDQVSWVVMATPSPFMREVAQRVKKFYSQKMLIMSVAKGIEVGSLKTMSQVLKEELNPSSIAVLSGPSHAEEVARGIPTSVSVASENSETAQGFQQLLMTDRFRIYTNSDLLGVEISGALKNVISIAAGISDGLGFGDNTKSALLTRGLAEMMRLGVAMGAKRETFYGLAGMGDLITTSFSPFGRNRKVGELLGKGKPLSEILAGTEMVAEGVKTSVAVKELSQKYSVEMPIAQKVYEVLYQGLAPLKAVETLMMREAKAEG